ncbi:motility associated factor glycosyltransferase family protein [Alkalibacillus sp. S2W]|uniref:motility associated factor glycosyltransferase family protein n=1 Tax=Alkalibacillus sp. S2W TaxID=3386553 RepID=UPI00398CE8BD
MFVDNINYLREHYPNLREQLKNIAPKYSIERMESKSGELTLNIKQHEKNNFIHSKYDPIKEAQSIIDRYQSQIDSSEKVFFYGLGLGYHVEVFRNRYPDHDVTVYEPSIDVFLNLAENRPLENVLKDSSLFVEVDSKSSTRFFNQYSQALLNKVTIIVLPSYQRIFEAQYQRFLEQFKANIHGKRINTLTNFRFKGRWTLNSLKNLSETISTPNLLDHTNKTHFQNKPAIIVSAGPSLNEEIDHLKYVKEQNLAYIFSVGSSINALIEHGIEPDAAFTYDPTQVNASVFTKVIERDYDLSIPLIYGTSVGFETLENYRGPKFHILTSQDTITPYFKSVKPQEYGFVHDAPSIAVITLQALGQLNVSPIIFVGQNLGYRQDIHYASGIDHRKKNLDLTDDKKKETFEVVGTQGETVVTTDGFNRMRHGLEHQINLLKQPKEIKFYNTTIDGAHINGTEFRYLSDIINDLSPIDTTFFLDHKNFVESNKDNHSEKIYNIFKSYEESLKSLFYKLKELNSSSIVSESAMRSYLNELNKAKEDVEKETFTKIIIFPIIRTELDIINQKLIKAIKEKELQTRYQAIVDLISNYYQLIFSVTQKIAPVYHQVARSLEDTVEDKA